MKCTFNSLALTFGSPHSGVFPYTSEHQEAVRRIAMASMSALTTLHRDAERAYQREIVGAIKDEAVVNKVYLYDGQPVGFVNYQFRYPWYDRFSPVQTRPRAEILHLAVDSQFRNKRVGEVLLDEALADARNRLAYRVDLMVTRHEKSLDRFYGRFGFVGKPSRSMRGPFLSPWDYTKRLKPTTVQHLSRTALDVISRLMRR